MLNTFKSQLKTPVGNNLDSNPHDIIQTRRLFSHLGRHDGDVTLSYIDRNLDRAIRAFQRDHKLKEDGLMYPGGETEQALNKALRLKADEEGAMPAVPQDKIEGEVLPLPNIPGTNIPDQSVSEQGDEITPSYDKDKDRYKIDPGIEKNPPILDPYILRPYNFDYPVIIPRRKWDT